MTVSRLTTSFGALRTLLVAKLTDAGYAFNSARTSLNQYLATVMTGLGTSSSALMKDRSEILALLAAAAGSSGNRFRDTDEELMARIINGTFGGGGGGSGNGFQLEDASGHLLLESGDTLLLEA
jgi:hypothetical protein